MTRQFLIIHGWQGNEAEHWQSILARQLKEKGEKMCYPQLPEAYFPKLEAWLTALHKEISLFSPDDELIVLTHSLGGALWLQYVSQHLEVNPAKVFLVAPPLDNCGISEIADFFPLPEIDLGIKKADYLPTGQAGLMVGSDNDPYIPLSKFQKLSGNLGVAFYCLPGKGHINVASGFGEWGWMEEQILNESK